MTLRPRSTVLCLCTNKDDAGNTRYCEMPDGHQGMHRDSTGFTFNFGTTHPSKKKAAKDPGKGESRRAWGLGEPCPDCHDDGGGFDGGRCTTCGRFP